MTDPATSTGGDPVCWLDRLCPDCAAMPSPESPDRCWRCGAVVRDRPWDTDLDPAEQPDR